MTTTGVKLTIQELFDLLYDLQIKEIPNPEYKESHISCNHYTIAEVTEKKYNYCPECSNKINIVSYSKTVLLKEYTINDICKKYFSGNGFKESGSNVIELIQEMLRNLIGYKSSWKDLSEDSVIYINGESFKLDANQHHDSFFLLSRTFRYCEDCDFSQENILANIEKYLNDYFYIICYSSGKDDIITVEYLKECIYKVELFKKAGLNQIKNIKIKEFSQHHCYY